MFWSRWLPSALGFAVYHTRKQMVAAFLIVGDIKLSFVIRVVYTRLEFHRNLFSFEAGERSVECYFETGKNIFFSVLFPMIFWPLMKLFSNHSWLWKNVCDVYFSLLIISKCAVHWHWLCSQCRAFPEPFHHSRLGPCPFPCPWPLVTALSPGLGYRQVVCVKSHWLIASNTLPSRVLCGTPCVGVSFVFRAEEYSIAWGRHICWSRS